LRLPPLGHRPSLGARGIVPEVYRVEQLGFG
jgi:hypothetical protein